MATVNDEDYILPPSQNCNYHLSDNDSSPIRSDNISSNNLKDKFSDATDYGNKLTIVNASTQERTNLTNDDTMLN